MSAQSLEAIRKGEFELDINDGRVKSVGLVILFITFGLFGTWAATAPLDSAALAPGVVTVETYRKTVQHLEGGIVEELLARDGDLVTTGQPLIVLDDTQVRAELGIVQGQIIAAKTLQARLQAERDGKSSFNYPDGLERQDTRAEEAYKNELAVFNARANSKAGEIDVLTQRIIQVDEQIKGIEQIIKSKGQLARSYREESSELSELLSDGFVDKQRVRELDRRSNELTSELADYRSSIAQSNVRKSETELQILQLEKQFQTEVVDQLSQIDSQLFDLAERERALKSRLERTVIRAPEDGMILGMQVHTIGGVIQSGAPILDIVPKTSDLIIEAQVSTVDIDRVFPETLADIRFSAFKSATTPVVQGVVTQISADRLVNESTGMPYYLAKVSLTPAGRELLGDLELVPGMPAEVLIKSGERTLLEYLAQPASNAFARSLIED